MKIIMVAAATIDGRISPAGLGSSHDRRLLESLRDETQASLLGAGTLRLDDPEMRCSYRKLPAGRIRALITFSGKIPTSGKKLFENGPPALIFTRKNLVAHLQRMFGEKAEVIPAPETEGHQLSIAALLKELSGRGVQQLLLEGGGSLNHACLEANVVDEIHLTILPYLAADSRAAPLVNGSSSIKGAPVALELLSSRTEESGEVFLHYKISRQF